MSTKIKHPAPYRALCPHGHPQWNGSNCTICPQPPKIKHPAPVVSTYAARHPLGRCHLRSDCCGGLHITGPCRDAVGSPLAPIGRR